MPHQWDDEPAGGVAVTQETRQKIDKPRLWKILLHNDNYTTMDFVVLVLVSVFRKQEAEAIRIMLDVHQKGIGVVGTYTYEIAETKVAHVAEMARQAEFPLLCTMEPE
ncbi:ATP-dependent Clp protease adaptor ClpS [Anaerolineae bacterium CFX7]|nr:ATP-dependent Clp protease adaptor ClpS [Anaerolineae bacterium CFX7]